MSCLIHRFILTALARHCLFTSLIYIISILKRYRWLNTYKTRW